MPVARNSKAKVSTQDKKDAPVIKRGRGRPAGDGTSGPRKAKKDFKFRAEDNLKVYIFRVLFTVHLTHTTLSCHLTHSSQCRYFFAFVNSNMFLYLYSMVTESRRVIIRNDDQVWILSYK